MIRVVIGALQRDGRWLVGRRVGGPLHGCLEFPGGKVEVGEDLEAALRREWKEELGVTLDRVGPLLYSHVFEQSGLHARFEALTYEVSTAEVPTCKVHSELLWLPTEQLRRERLAPSLTRAIMEGHHG